MITSPKKMKYSITQIQPANQVWYYEVEAESEELAILSIQSGEVDAIDYRVESSQIGGEYDEVEYEVTDVEDAEEVNNA